MTTDSGMGPRGARQLYYGPLYSQGIQTVRALEPWVRNIGRVGQLNPFTAERLRMQRGRYLSGLGQAPPVAPDGGDPRYESGHLKTLEHQDDCYGSGIFDGPDGPVTANADMGIFGSDYALPGYVGREVPYTVSRDITDITTGGAVVMMPAGGQYAVVERSKLVPFPVLGPTPRPPALSPARPTPIDQVYVNHQRGPARAPLNAGVRARPMPLLDPARTFQSKVHALPYSPPQVTLPISPAQLTLPSRSTVNPLGAVAPAPGPTGGQMAIAGLMLGAAAAIWSSGR